MSKRTEPGQLKPQPGPCVASARAPIAGDAAMMGVRGCIPRGRVEPLREGGPSCASLSDIFFPAQDRYHPVTGAARMAAAQYTTAKVFRRPPFAKGPHVARSVADAAAKLSSITVLPAASRTNVKSRDITAGVRIQSSGAKPTVMKTVQCGERHRASCLSVAESHLPLSRGNLREKSSKGKNHFSRPDSPMCFQGRDGRLADDKKVEVGLTGHLPGRVSKIAA